jgi:tetratricopeptide (TPR) repeat protein
MLASDSYNTTIENAFKQHEGDVVAFANNLVARVRHGLPEELLVAARGMLEKETDPLRTAWLRILVARINTRKLQYKLIAEDLAGIPEDESLPAPLRAYAYSILATMNLALVEFEDAYVCCKKGLDLSDGDEDPAAIEIFNSLAIYHLYKGRYTESVHYIERHIKTLKSMGRNVSSGIYNNYALMLASCGDIDGAIDAFKTSLDIEERTKNPLNIALALSNISGFFLAQRKPKQALDYAERAFETMRYMEENSIRSVTLINISQSRMMLGDFEAALEPAEQALVLARSSNRDMMIDGAMLHHAILCARLGKPDAAALLKEAIEFNDSLKLTNQHDSYELACYEYSKLVEPEAARGLLTKAKEVARGRRPLWPRVKYILEDINKALGDI